MEEGVASCRSGVVQGPVIQHTGKEFTATGDAPPPVNGRRMRSCVRERPARSSSATSSARLSLRTGMSSAHRLYLMSLSLVEVATLVELYKQPGAVEACDPLRFVRKD